MPLLIHLTTQNDSSFLQFIFFFHFLLFLQYSATDIQAQAPDYYLNHSCSTTKTFTSDSPYYSNLKTLLSSLSSHATGADEFYNATVHGGADDTIYGLFLCRGDVTPQICKNCLQMAIHKIASRCFYSKEAIVWYHECLVRYSNHSFFSTVEESPSLWRVYNTSVPYSLEQGSVGWVLANTLNAAMAEAADGVAAGEKKFATRTGKVWGDSNEKVYTLVQCSPDLRSEDCKKCLGDMMKDIRMCCLGKDGGMVLNPSCSMMFGSQMFYRDIGTVRARGPPHPSLADAGKAGEEGEKKVNYSRTIIMVISPVVVSVMLYYFAIYLLRRKARKRYAILKENFGTECTTLESLQFDLATIEAATNGFSYENRIGQGGFGEVYKGTLSDGKEIAVKRLSMSSEQGAMEFKNEVLLIAKLQHRNLVTLLGFCLQEHEKILVYEFVPNKSLDYFLFDPQKQRLLSWSKRFKIIEGVARAILYLHEHSRLKIIHRDLKPSNVLLDNNMNPKLSDFGLARMVSIDQDQGRTRRIVGTYGYMPPEYALFGKFSEKSDIFSFGVMILEIVSGKKNASSYESPHIDGLLTHAWRHWRDEKALEIMDPNLGESFCETEVSKCIQIALLCVQENAEDRPHMSRVVSYLSNLSVELPRPHEPAFYVHGRMDPNVVTIESNSGQSTNTHIPSSVNEMSITISFPR